MSLRFRGQRWYAILAILVIASWWYRDNIRPTGSSDTFKIGSDVHPIAQLTARAEKQWWDLLEKQSKTLEEAVAEYRARYGRRPPKGFDQWYRWSVDRGVKLIDEGIHRDLLPFWGLSPAQIEGRRRDLVEATGSDRFFRLQVRDGVLSDDPESPASSEKWPINKRYHKLLEGISHFLPDMNMTINLYDVPLVYLSREERQRLVDLGEAGRFMADEEHEAHHVQFDPEQSDLSWKDLRRMCPSDSAIFTSVGLTFTGAITLTSRWEQEQLSFRLPASQGAFIYDHARAMDLCHNPELIWQHGNFIVSVEEGHVRNLKRNYLYPLFSWSNYAGSSDITVPTSYRFDDENGRTTDWEELAPKIAWSGTLSGIWPYVKGDIMSSQRYRLADLLSSFYTLVPALMEHAPATDQDAASPRQDRFELQHVAVGELNAEWMNVNFVANKEDFPTDYLGNLTKAKVKFGSWMGYDERNKNKMMLDVDGWGWSARYRSLLWTGSPVLKATVFKEIISDWLIPWYHYIPLDYAYRDMYSIALYYLGLSGTSQKPHDRELRLMGRRARKWVEEHATWDHHLSYMYRLGLEWARVTSDDRASMDYVG